MMKQATIKEAIEAVNGVRIAMIIGVIIGNSAIMNDTMRFVPLGGK